MKHISDIRFPVFKIRQHNSIVTKDGLTLVESSFDTWVLDNKNLEGENLGERRARMTRTPYLLQDPIHTIEDLIKGSLNCKYVDYDGTVFRYKKDKFYVVLTYPCEIDKLGGFRYRIKLIGPGKTIMYYSLRDYSDSKYCTVVKVSGGFLVYGFSDRPLMTTRRKL